jgi:hypothetical protein
MFKMLYDGNHIQVAMDTQAYEQKTGLTYVFTVYLTTLSVAQAVQR